MMLSFKQYLKSIYERMLYAIKLNMKLLFALLSFTC